MEWRGGVFCGSIKIHSTPKKKKKNSIRSKNSKFLLKSHKVSCRITFWKLKCGFPNFTQIIPVYPCKPLSPGEGAETGWLFSGNLPRICTGLRQHISQWGKHESVWAVYSETVHEGLISSRTCRSLTRACLFRPAALSCSINTISVSMDTLSQSHKDHHFNRSKLYSSASIIIITAHTPQKCVYKVVFSKYKEHFKKPLNHGSKVTK